MKRKRKNARTKLSPLRRALREQLARLLRQWIEPQKVSRTVIAQRLHGTRPQISALANGRYERFTVDRLIEFCSHAGLRVEFALAEPDVTLCGAVLSPRGIAHRRVARGGATHE